MGRVLPAEPAVLVLLKLVDRLLTLVGRVVAVPAFGTHEEHVTFFGLHGILLVLGRRSEMDRAAGFARRAPHNKQEVGGASGRGSSTR